MAKLRFPLQKHIQLYMEDNDIFECYIKYAGKNILKCINTVRLLREDTGAFHAIEYPDPVILNRLKVIGYVHKDNPINSHFI